MRGSYYDVLGLSQTAGDEEIRARYLRLIRRYHPDLNQSSLAPARAAEINEAYRHLSNPSLRAGHNAQLNTKRQKVVAARAISDSRHRPSTGPAHRRRPSLLRRYGAGIAFGALLLGTGVAGWQMQMRLPKGAGGVSPASSSDGEEDGQRAVAELMAASAQAAQSMPGVSRQVVRQGAKAFTQLDRQRPEQAEQFSKLCHARASNDDDWNTLDFCVAFDEAAFAQASRHAGQAPSAYFVSRHDGAVHSYIYRVASMDAIERRLARIQRLVRAGPSPQRGPVDRVLHGISKRGRAFAGAAWQAVGVQPEKQPVKAHDF